MKQAYPQQAPGQGQYPQNQGQYPPLQGPQLAVGKTARILPLQSLKEGFGFQARVEGELVFELRPDRREGIGPRPPGVLHAYLAGQLLQPPVFASSLVIQARLGRRLARRQALVVETKQASDLLIGDPHLEPPYR